MSMSDKCDECGGLHYLADAKPGEKVCDCREKRHKRRVDAHNQAVGALKDALDRQGKAKDDAGRTAVLLAGMARAMLAMMEAMPPGDY